MKKSILLYSTLGAVMLVVISVVLTLGVGERVVLRKENHALKERIEKHEFLIEQIETEKMWNALDNAMISLHLRLVCSREVETNDYLAFVRTGQAWATLFLDHVMVKEQRGWMSYSRIMPKGQVDVFRSIYGERVGPTVERNVEKCHGNEKRSEKVMNILINHL